MYIMIGLDNVMRAYRLSDSRLVGDIVQTFRQPIIGPSNDIYHPTGRLSPSGEAV